MACTVPGGWASGMANHPALCRSRRPAGRREYALDNKRAYELPEHVRRPVQKTVTLASLPIIGPADYIVEQMMRYETELGVTHLAVGLHEAEPLAEHLKAIERFAKEVLPQIPGHIPAA